MGLFCEVMNLNAQNIVSAQQILVTFIIQFSMKDKRTDLKLYLTTQQDGFLL